jgi:hypothetical protein
MKIGVRVGQGLEQLERFRAGRDAGFDFVSWGHHWLIHPFHLRLFWL